MRRTERFTINRLRKYRLRMGYEQRQVAFLLGMRSHACISEWERGVSKPNLDNVLQLSIVYRTLPDELYYDLRQSFIKDIEGRQRTLFARQDEGG